MKDKLLIFGGSGFLGNAIVEHAQYDFNIISFARGESKQAALKKRFPRINIEIGNIQDEKDVNRAMSKYRPTFIVIAAALKDISICQQFPNECIKTNIVGIQNVLKSLEGVTNPFRTVCFVSTDKAVEPINIYGTSKYLGEQLIDEFNNKHCRLYSVRYGNVLGSTGSLLPLLKEQIKIGVIKVTNPEMTRFNLDVKQAVETIFYGFNNNIRGVLIPTKLKSFRIGDVVDVLAKKHQFKVEIIGAQPFEKKHEILIGSQEKAELVDNYLLIKKDGNYSNIAYSSENSVMSIEELKETIADYI